MKQIKQMGRKLSGHPENYVLWKTYYVNKRRLSVLVKRKLEARNNSLVTQLLNEKTNPKKFWKIVNKNYRMQQRVK